MVDSIGPTGNTQNLNQIDATKRARESKTEEARESREARDTVEISEEAINLAQAEQVAKEAAQALAENEGITLSSDQNRLNELA